jgi:hypothetical protein
MDFENQAVLDYFTALGFEEIPIEEGLSALSFEESPEGEYALITDEDGSIPKSLDIPLMLACYTEQGAFLWSTGFKNAAQFQEIWSIGSTYTEKLKAAEQHREEIIDPNLRAQLSEG